MAASCRPGVVVAAVVTSHPDTSPCTAIQSSVKSRAVEFAALVTRTWKLAFDRSAGVQPRPHEFAAPPSVRDAMLVVSVGVASGVVQETPPSHDSSTHIRGEPDVLSTRLSSRTSIPLPAAAAWAPTAPAPC